MNTNRRFILGMLTGAGSVLLKSALNLLIVPLIIVRLGLDVFGLNILLIGLQEIAVFFGLGVANALVSLVGKNAHDEASRHRYFWAGHVFFAGVTVVFLLGALGLIPFFATLFHIPRALQPLLTWGLPLALLEAALSIYAAYYQSVLLIHCEHRWTNTADSLQVILNNIGTIVILLLGGNLVGLILFRVVTAVLRIGFLILRSLILEPALFQNAVLDTACFKQLSRLFGHAMTINLSVIVSHKLDAYVIAGFLPLTSVAVYDTVFRMLGLANIICLKLSEGAFPLFSKMAGERVDELTRKENAVPLFLRLSQFIAFVGGLILVVMVTQFPVVFPLFTAGRIPLHAAVPVLLIAIPCVFSGIMQMPAGSWLFAWGYQRYMTETSLMTAIVNIVLSLLLVGPLGIVGVALGTLAPQVIQHQAGLIRRSCQALKISGRRYCETVYGRNLPAWLAAGLVIGLCYGILSFYHLSFVEKSWRTLLPIGLISSMACLLSAAIWAFGNTTDAEKNRVHGFYTRYIARKAYSA